MRAIRNPICRALALDRRGTAAIELALVAPALIVMVLGISDVAMTTLAKFKSLNAAATAADLAAQAANLQPSDMSDIFVGAAGTIAPLPSATLSFRITSIYSDGLGHAFVHWSCATGSLSPLGARTSFSTLANGNPVGNVLNLYTYLGGGYVYAGANTTIVQAEVAYSYTPPARFVIKNAQAMASAFYVMPRQAGYVGFPWGGDPLLQPPLPMLGLFARTTTLVNGATCSYSSLL